MISFMNTFFVASILICCLLVLMLIYNFRQRLNTVESNYKLTLDMLNNVVQKMNMIENENMSSGGYVSQEMNIPYVDISEHQSQQHGEFDNEESDNEESDNEESDNEESDNDGDDEDSDNDGDDEDSDNNDEGEISTEDRKENDIDIDGDDDDASIRTEDGKEIDIVSHDDDDASISTEDGKELALSIENKGEFNYDKMSLTQLRSLVKTRGLSTSVSKMKKSDALALLTR